jgi:hypothetical protein
MRQLAEMKNDMRYWTGFYRVKAGLQPAGYIRERFEEHAQNCDELWHDLDAAQRTLVFWQTPRSKVS